MWKTADKKKKMVSVTEEHFPTDDKKLKEC